jgi:hypothetical protein
MKVLGYLYIYNMDVGCSQWKSLAKAISFGLNKYPDIISSNAHLFPTSFGFLSLSIWYITGGGRFANTGQRAG